MNNYDIRRRLANELTVCSRIRDRIQEVALAFESAGLNERSQASARVFSALFARARCKMDRRMGIVEKLRGAVSDRVRRSQTAKAYNELRFAAGSWGRNQELRKLMKCVATCYARQVLPSIPGLSNRPTDSSIWQIDPSEIATVLWRSRGSIRADNGIRAESPPRRRKGHLGFDLRS